ASMAPKFEAAVHALRDAKYVKDIRNLGMVAGVELEPRDGAPGARAYEAFVKCFEAGVLIRFTGDILAFSPPLIIDEAQIDQIFQTVRNALASIQ
ncbi:MAG TPA: aminotransferase class III-fold pyridoxal phosphate-dependent enzyme, partial [Paraburkholderia sp.]|nr:aminotransferase class III-fold pyridoxal phosphate-dependent enzyme [Paraburkholderia sp.]